MKHETTRRVWAAVSQMAAAGERPTIREIMRHTGIRSTSWVHHHLVLLEDAGYISRGPKDSAGTLRVLVPLVTGWKQVQ